MKKQSLIALTILCGLPLASCSGGNWSWWEDDNVTIEKFISLKDAQAALDSSSKQYDQATVKSVKATYNTYYKDYLGKFSTETDSNISNSSSQDVKKYTNNIVVSNAKTSGEEKFLNAKSVVNANVDTYRIPEADKSVTIRTITDYGYGEKIGKDTTIPYTTDEAYNLALSIGSTLGSSSITWDKATYGFAKNNNIIIETMSSVSGTYTVKFNGKSLTTFVTNTFNLYRLAQIGNDEEGNAVYMMDYSYTKVESLIGSTIFDEPLDEPFLLEKAETVTKYSINDNKAFDTSNIPDISK